MRINLLKLFAIAALSASWWTLSAAQPDGLSDVEQAGWNEGRDDINDGLMDPPTTLEDLAYCSVVWFDWQEELKETNRQAVPAALDLKSAETHSWGYEKVFEMTAQQQRPDWTGTAASFGPYLDAMAEVKEAKESFPDEFFWALAWCYREDLFQKSREN